MGANESNEPQNPILDTETLSELVEKGKIKEASILVSHRASELFPEDCALNCLREALKPSDGHWVKPIVTELLSNAGGSNHDNDAAYQLTFGIGDFAYAREIAREHQDDPDPHKHWVGRLAYSSSAIGDEETSLRCYRTLLASKRTSKICWENVAVSLRVLQRYTEMLDLVKEMREELGDIPEAAKIEYQAYAGLKKYELALAALNRALSLEPNADVQRSIGITLRHLGRFTEANEAFEKLLDFGVSPNEVFTQKGETFEWQSDHANALKQFRMAVNEDPHDDHARAHLATALLYMGNLKDALSEYQSVDRNSEFGATALANSAAIEFALGNTDEALRSIDCATAICPDDSSLLEERAAILLGRDPRMSIDLLEPLGLELSARGKQILASGYYKIGDYAKALSTLDSVPRTVSYSHDFNRGLVLIRLRRVEDAISAFESALAALPENRSGMVALAYARLLAHRAEDAMPLAEQILLLNEDDADGLYLVAEASIELGTAYDDDFFQHQAIEASGRFMSLAAGRSADVDLISAIHEIRAVAFARIRRYNKATDELNALLRTKRKAGVGIIQTKANLARLRQYEHLATPVPRAVAWTVLIACALSFIESWLAIINRDADAHVLSTILISSLIIPLLLFLLPALSRVKAAGIELERSAMIHEPQLELTTQSHLRVLDAHFNGFDIEIPKGIPGFVGVDSNPIPVKEAQSVRTKRPLDTNA